MNIFENVMSTSFRFSILVFGKGGAVFLWPLQTKVNKKEHEKMKI